MADDNGTGNGGGNGSVYWEIKRGKTHATKFDVKNKAAVAAAPGGAPAGANLVQWAPQVSAHVGKGEVKIGPDGVEGHADTTFNDIGKWKNPANKPPDHPGKFRVRLRFRDVDLEALEAAQRDWIMMRAKRDGNLNPDSWFLEIDVPAIQRAEPVKDKDPWPNQPWEIHWEW